MWIDHKDREQRERERDEESMEKKIKKNTARMWTSLHLESGFRTRLQCLFAVTMRARGTDIQSSPSFRGNMHLQFTRNASSLFFRLSPSRVSKASFLQRTPVTDESIPFPFPSSLNLIPPPCEHRTNYSCRADQDRQQTTTSVSISTWSFGHTLQIQSCLELLKKQYVRLNRFYPKGKCW